LVRNVGFLRIQELLRRLIQLFYRFKYGLVGDTILKTTDGGTNWNNQTSGITNRLNAVYFVDDTAGWAVGAGGIILRTITGGYGITSLQKPSSPRS